MSDLHSDQPTTDDLLQRKPFAEQLATVIAAQSDPSPLVLSLNGVWGDGKSTVLGFLEASLRDTHKLIVVSFNPWAYSTEDDMLRGLFDSLADELEVPLLTKTEKAFEKASTKLGGSDWQQRSLRIASVTTMKRLGAKR